MDDDRKHRFEAVYKETYEHILGYAVRRCESPEDAADVVAETFAIAWRRFDALPAGGEARLWLYGVARNVLANHRRGLARHRHSSLTLVADVADLYAYSPEGSVELSTIAHAFRELSDDDRELISLVAWEGLDHGEIARVLSCSRNAARIRLHRARKRLSKALSNAGFTTDGFAVEFI
ncbi:RNA polymerase sigma factor [Nonomuraea gerenzanensis]|uniref:Putative RNA polymerase ECF-subfamily sigma factor n=1 Tax=Nonomuraea gerenzanensis TaxID=93944 RepID=A0A1M4E380_9ACTN|nr:RNA polymerase sigma factor [Nonomuraea gerenzanensis]UBU15494.1 RNA polymerase sigma factor [Nonomuraea gerenzanensis]SBO93256.1 putative RNA polymerase ECF-subfamily sigma factor [Nonomuraea gerenzanensis]